MRKRIKAISMLLMCSLLTGCTQKTKQEVINISILNTKPEIQKSMENAAETFVAKHPDIKVKVIPHNSLQGMQDKIFSMKSTGTTPTLMATEPLFIQDIRSDLASLQNEAWVNDMQVTMGEASMNEQGELIAFPMALECMGFIYNESVMKEAGIDVKGINTREKLEEAFKKVEQTGRKALVISNEDWSLSNHFLTTAFTVQSEDSGEIIDYIEKLRAGKIDLTTDEKVNGLLDTFDLMKQYNIYKESPLVPTSEKCAELLATKQVGFWYMGNWATADLAKYAENGEVFKMMPVPISNNASDYGNNELIGVIKYLVVDQKDNSLEQQEAAKTFLNWLVYEEAGQNFMVNEAGLIPGAIGNEVVYRDTLAQSIQDYQQEGKVIEQVTVYLPDDNATSVGGLMRQYLDNKITREVLLESIEAVWKK